MARKIGKRSVSSTLPLPLFDEDFTSGVTLFCGADEAGRGPIAGPVFAAAVILDPDHPIVGLKDSKKLSGHRRDELALEIRKHAKAWAIAECSIEEIDELNILHASMLAMKRAIDSLPIRPELALIDGNRCPKLAIAPQKPSSRATTRCRLFRLHPSLPKRHGMPSCWICIVNTLNTASTAIKAIRQRIIWNSYIYTAYRLSIAKRMLLSGRSLNPKRFPTECFTGCE